jgi:hypothetical protein
MEKMSDQEEKKSKPSGQLPGYRGICLELEGNNVRILTS